jgi:hypothetical protein
MLFKFELLLPAMVENDVNDFILWLVLNLILYYEASYLDVVNHREESD